MCLRLISISQQKENLKINPIKPVFIIFFSEWFYGLSYLGKVLKLMTFSESHNIYYHIKNLETSVVKKLKIPSVMLT